MKRNVQIGLVVVIAVCIIGAIVRMAILGQQEEAVDELRGEVVSVVSSSGETGDYRVIDFEQLWAENDDVVAWISIPNSQVDYPILQSKEDEPEDYYLQHNFDHSSGLPGCIYIQKRNDADFTDPDTVIYGHNMRNGSMFGDMDKMYGTKEDFEENKYIEIYTPEDGLSKYQVFCVCTYDDRLILDYFKDFENQEDFTTYLDEVMSLGKSNGVVDESIEVTKDDNIITLSTCNNIDTQRYLIHAVRIEE